MLFASRPLSPQGRHVLVTSASDGPGREIALYLVEQGFQMIAGARCQEDGERLTNVCPSGRINTSPINITGEESAGRAAARVVEEVGDTGLRGLANNAGVYISVPPECVSSDLLRRQLEVNLIGRLVIIRTVPPLLRRGSAARLVNATSGFGLVIIPYLGAYFTAQLAKEGASDTLRHGLAPMGIQASVVSPGAIQTPIWGRIASEGECALADAPDAVVGPYRDTYLHFLQTNESGARNSATRPVDVAATTHAAFTAAKPRARYRVGAGVRRGTLPARLLSDSVVDGMFRPTVTAVPAAKEE